MDGRRNIVQNINLEKHSRRTDTPPNKIQKNPTLIALLTLIGILLVVGLLLQLWIKPMVEQELSTILKDNFKANGLQIADGDVQCTVSPFNREVTIHAYTLTSENDTEITQIKYGTTTAKFTLKGLLAFSPLAGIVLPNDGKLLVATQTRTDTIDIISVNGNISCKSFLAHNISLSAASIQKIRTTGEMPLDGVWIEKSSFEKMQISFPNEKERFYSTGQILLSDLTPQTLDNLQIEDIVIHDAANMELQIKSFHIAKIRVPSQKEYLDLTQNFTQISEEDAGKYLLQLFLGENPLLQEIAFMNIQGKQDSAHIQISQISFTADASGSKHKFSLQGLQILGQGIRDIFGKDLPVPELLHVDFSTELAKQTASTRVLATRFNVDELFSLESSITAEMKDLQNFLDNSLVTPIHDLSARFEDKSLFARGVLVLIPSASPEAILLKELQGQIPLNPEEKDLSEALQTFVKKPGAILVQSKTTKPFTFSELSELDEADAVRRFTITVEPGEQSLDEQVQMIKGQ